MYITMCDGTHSSSIVRRAFLLETLAINLALLSALSSTSRSLWNLPVAETADPSIGVRISSVGKVLQGDERPGVIVGVLSIPLRDPGGDRLIF